MKVVLERKCTATRKWFPVAKFEMGLDAIDCAEMLSKADGLTYRTIDPRWPDEGAPQVVVYVNGMEVS